MIELLSKVTMESLWGNLSQIEYSSVLEECDPFE